MKRLALILSFSLGALFNTAYANDRTCADWSDGSLESKMYDIQWLEGYYVARSDLEGADATDKDGFISGVWYYCESHPEAKLKAAAATIFVERK